MRRAALWAALALAGSGCGALRPCQPAVDRVAMPARMDPAALVGTRWRLVALRTPAFALRVPPGQEAPPGLDFMSKPPAGAFLPPGETAPPGALALDGRDGCNSFSGYYVADENGLRVHPVASTLVGCTGGPQATLTSLFSAILGGGLWYAREGDTLHLSTDGFGGAVLLFRRMRGPFWSAPDAE